MSNRYLDENGEENGRNLWLSTIKTRSDAVGFFKLMGIKEVTTARQKKNGTTVYELPIRKLSYTGNSYAYKYAIYDSGYIRDVSEHCHSPWYINKRYQTRTKYWNSYYKEYGNYTGFKPIFIENFDDQLVYLANYILKNRYGSKLYSCCDFNIEQIEEQREFMYDHKWRGNTVTIPRDEYNELKKAKPLATNKVTIDRDEYERMKEAYAEVYELDNVLIAKSEYDKLKRTQLEKDNGYLGDEIAVIINGTRYNLS